MKNRFLNLILLTAFITLISCSSCTSGSECGNIATTENDTTTKVFSKIIEKYNSLNLGEEKNELSSVNEIYVDLSDGLTKYALSKKNNVNLFKSFLTSISNENDLNRYFELSQDSIIPYFNNSPIQYFLQTGHRTEKGDLKQGAPLDLAINRISNSNNISILVTDGELYDSKLKMISQEMWASEALTTWFKKGNKLSIIYSDFTENNNGNTYNKHMYIMFFVPKNYDGKILNNFMSDLNLDSSVLFKKLDFLTDVNGLWERKYPDSQTPGTTRYIETGFDPNPISFFSENSFEYINLTSGEINPESEGSIVNVLRDLGDDNGRPKNYPLLEKLFFNFNNIPNYDVQKIKLKVSNITSDFKDFKRNYFAQENLPIILKTADGKDSLNLDNYLEFNTCMTTIDGEIAYDLNNKTQNDTINKFSNMLFENFSYPISYSKPVLINDFVIIDETAGKVNEINDENSEYEIVIKFDKSFSSQTNGFNNEENNLIRIDVIIDEVNLKPIDKKALTWNKISEDGLDETLYRSLTNTLKNSAPVEKILYTYYIEFGPFNN